MSDLERMKKLAGILNEGIAAVPCIGRADLKEEYDHVGFIKQAIGDTHPVSMPYDELLRKVGKETGYSNNPEFPAMFKKAHDSFYGLDIDFHDEDDVENDEDDYTDYTMRQGEMGNPDKLREGDTDMLKKDIKDIVDATYVPGSTFSDEEVFEIMDMLDKKYGGTSDYVEDDIRQAMDEMGLMASEDEVEDDGYCTSCAGTGEGQYDGTKCRSCGGKGFNRGVSDDDFDEPDPVYRDDFYEAGKSENRDLWDKINSKGVVPGIDREKYTDLSYQGLEGPFRHKSGKVVYYDPKEGKYYDRDTDMYLDDFGMNEEYDLNNGYEEVEIDPSDYFPDGADGPVVRKVGPSGARQGDNPEQKRMAVSEEQDEITNDMVKDAYEKRHHAFVNDLPNRYQLADYASRLANQYEQQQSMKHHGTGFDPITGALLKKPDQNISETHKELVYSYRKFLKENTGTFTKVQKKSNAELLGEAEKRSKIVADTMQHHYSIFRKIK